MVDRRRLAGVFVLAVDQTASGRVDSDLHRVCVRRSGPAPHSRARNGDRRGLSRRARLAARRSVPSRRESHCSRALAPGTIRVRLERLFVQQRERVQLVVDSRRFLESGQQPDRLHHLVPAVLLGHRARAGCASAHRVALRARAQRRSADGSMRGSADRVLRALDAHARTLYLRRPDVHDRVRTARAPVSLGRDCALDRTLCELGVLAAVPAGHDGPDAGRRSAKPVGTAYVVLFADCRRHVLHSRLRVLGFDAAGGVKRARTGDGT